MKQLIISSCLLIVCFWPIMAQAQEPSVVTAYQTLWQQAQTDGQVRVVVQLNLPFQTAGELSAQEAFTQQQAITTAQDEILNDLATTQATLNRRYQYIPAMALTVDSTALEELAASSHVSHIELDRRWRPTLDRSTSLIGATRAWDLGYTGQGWTVAVLDTGVDSDHSFLRDKVVSEACFSTTVSLFDVTSACPNGRSSQIGPGAGITCNAFGCDHGSHVAGIAVGRGDNFSGVAREANLISIQVFSIVDDVAFCADGGELSPCTTAYISDIIAGLEQVFRLRNEFNIASVNLSLGGGRYFSVADCDAQNRSVKSAIDNLRSVGIATLIASGNSGYKDSMNEPACVSSAISVGATDVFDRVAAFSNSAFFLDLLAPGVNIYSSVPNNRFDSFSGTSMAAPHVAGAWAIHKQLNPDASVDELLTFFKETGIPVRDSTNRQTTPRLQVDTDLPDPAMVLTLNIDQPVAQVGEAIRYSYRVNNIGNVELTLSANDDQLGAITFEPNPVAPGEIAIADRTYVVQDTDLPGPIVNNVTVTAQPSRGLVLIETANDSVDLTALDITLSTSMNRAKVGEPIFYHYRAINQGSVDLTLSGSDDQIGPLIFEPSTVSPGNTASANISYTVTSQDLPGPLNNNVTITGQPADGSIVQRLASESVDLTQLFTITPTSTTTQTLTTADQTVELIIPPGSIITTATGFDYTRMSQPRRLPGVPTGLAFDLTLSEDVNLNSEPPAQDDPDDPAPFDAVVGIGSSIITAGQQLTLPLTTTVISGALALATVDVTYDPAVVELTTCQPNPNRDFDFGICNRDQAGILILETASVNGVSGTLSLADLTFEAIGTVGQITPLTVTIDTFISFDNQDMSVQLTNGQICINQCTIPVLKMVIHYDRLPLPSTVAEEELTVYRYDLDQRAWLTMTVVASDTTMNTLTLEPSQFGEFVLTGRPFTDRVYLPVISKPR